MAVINQIMVHATELPVRKQQPRSGYVCCGEDGEWCGTVHLKLDAARQCCRNNPSRHIIEMENRRPQKFVERRQRRLL